MDIPNMIEGSIPNNESLYRELERLRIENENLRVENAALKKQSLYHEFFRKHEQLAETVLNRPGIDLMFSHELGRIKRHGKLTCLALDLNEFKKINDTYGHQTGDKIIIAAALAIYKSIRSTDLMGRIGGDEFVVGLVDADEKEAVEVAQRIQEYLLLTTKEVLPHLPISPTVSIGIAQAKENDYLEALSERADRALYKAKEEKNKIHVFSQELLL